MRIKHLYLFVLLAILFIGCHWFSMEPTWPDLKLVNQSDEKLQILINTQYPDTSLSKAIIDRYINPNSSGYIGTSLSLKNSDDIGYTIFAFRYAYFEDQWHEGVGSPESFLAEDSALAKWIFLKTEVDSLEWEIVYP